MAIENLPFDPASPVHIVYSRFRTLILARAESSGPDPNLGGKLLYAGELDEEGQAIAIAGNVAGCATLATTADIGAQKLSIRSGVVDFLVTSLSEALRILKNEIRKHGTVAVCVGMPPADIEAEMLERGVEPDLTRESADPDRFLLRWRAASQPDAAPMQAPALVAWQAATSPARWLPKLDAIALESLAFTDGWNRRWLRLSPRYLGRFAPNWRFLYANREFAASFVERSRRVIDKGEIATTATILIRSEAGFEEHHFSPAPKS